MKFRPLGRVGDGSGESRRNALIGEGCCASSAADSGEIGLMGLWAAEVEPMDAAALLSAVEPMERLESLRWRMKFANSWLTRNTGKRGGSGSSSGSSSPSSGMTVDLKRIRSHLWRRG